MLLVLAHLEFLLQVLLLLLGLDLLQLLVGQRLEVGRVLRVRLSTGGTQAVLVCADPMPAEPAYLTTDGSRKVRSGHSQVTGSRSGNTRGGHGQNQHIAESRG